MSVTFTFGEKVTNFNQLYIVYERTENYEF